MPNAVYRQNSGNEVIELPSDKSVGITFAVVFALIGAFPMVYREHPRYWSITIAAIFLAFALLAPGKLRYLNRIWFRFGMFLHAFANPIMLGLIYALIIVPMAVLVKLTRGKLLSPVTASNSYWVLRQPSEPTPESMRHQF